jgi:adenosine deaminase
MRADPRIVGLNIAAPEDAPRSRRDFDAQMEILDFLWHKFDKPAITLHAGELTLSISPVESMWDRISKSIQTGHARRIGHGVSIAWERELAALLESMRDQGIMVEINLSSNEGILGVAGDSHPFLLYQSAGVPMCITTDDEGVNRSNLTMEYVKAVQRYNLDYSALKQISRNCLEFSFIPGSSLFVDHDYQHIRSEFAGLDRSEWLPDEETRSALSTDPKLNRQIMLERAFYTFEQDRGNRE